MKTLGLLIKLFYFYPSPLTFHSSHAIMAHSVDNWGDSSYDSIDIGLTESVNCKVDLTENKKDQNKNKSEVDK